MHLEPRQPLGDGRGARQEGGADAIGLGPEAEVEARGLDLPRLDRGRGADRAGLDHADDRPIRENPGAIF